MIRRLIPCSLTLATLVFLPGGCASSASRVTSHGQKGPAIATIGHRHGTAESAPGKPAYAVETAPTTRPDLDDRATSAQAHWDAAARILERKGVATDLVYTITIPRDDWDVTIEGMGLPVQAGIASVFHFYRCPCGKTVIVGQFCLADYELNDVVDELRKARIEVVSIAPMLLHSRANPQILRFQSEGKTEPLSKALREALRWTGKERMAPEPGVLPKLGQ